MKRFETVDTRFWIKDRVVDLSRECWNLYDKLHKIAKIATLLSIKAGDNLMYIADKLSEVCFELHYLNIEE